MNPDHVHKRRIGDGWPPPIVDPPLELPHLHTFILLHGRNFNAAKFRRPLMHHPIPEHDTLRKAFPHAKFVFPSAQFLRANDFDRIPITQWFDVVGKGKHRNAHPGEIGASCQYLFTLMQKAIREVGAENVIVGGWSQGCAVSLVTMLLWEGPPIAAIVGMSGRLQFRDVIVNEIVAADGVSDDPGKAIAWLRASLLGRQSSTLSHSPRKLSPVYLGHGIVDPQIAIEQARLSEKMLKRLGADVHYREYDELGHGFNGEMLKDIVEFVYQRLPARAGGKDTEVRSAL
jgi:predicted esterase